MERFLFVLLCITIAICWRTINALGTFLLAKADAIIDDVNRRDSKDTAMKIENTSNLMNLIRQMIENEVMNKLKDHIQLHKAYPTLNFDKDSKIIATRVYSAFEDSLADNPSIFISIESIQEFIIKESFKMFLSAINAHNSTLRNGDTEQVITEEKK